MKHSHNPPNRIAAMTGPNPSPQPDVQDSGPMRTAYVVDRIGNGWRFRVCDIPESVVSQHVTEAYRNAEPDVFPITNARMAGHLHERVMKGES